MYHNDDQWMEITRLPAAAAAEDQEMMDDVEWLHEADPTHVDADVDADVDTDVDTEEWEEAWAQYARENALR